MNLSNQVPVLELENENLSRLVNALREELTPLKQREGVQDYLNDPLERGALTHDAREATGKDAGNCDRLQNDKTEGGG